MNEYQSHIYTLAVKWRMNLLTDAECREFDQWFRMMEDTFLGAPVEMTVDMVEKRLHQMMGEIKPDFENPDAPKNPLGKPKNE